MKAKEVAKHLLITGIGAAAFLWMISPLVWIKQAKKYGESHPVRIMEADFKSEEKTALETDIETLIYGHDNGTDFVPGVKTGGLVISPEEDYYHSLELMAKVVEAEAGNQGLLGKRLVVDVILNRLRDEEFPDTIVDVIYEENAFAVIGNGMYEQVEISGETWKAIEMEMKEVSYPGLFYFCSKGFHEYGTPWEKVGDHYFSTK